MISHRIDCVPTDVKRMNAMNCSVYDNVSICYDLSLPIIFSVSSSLYLYISLSLCRSLSLGLCIHLFFDLLLLEYSFHPDFQFLLDLFLIFGTQTMLEKSPF